MSKVNTAQVQCVHASLGRPRTMGCVRGCAWLCVRERLSTCVCWEKLINTAQIQSVHAGLGRPRANALRCFTGQFHSLNKEDDIRSLFVCTIT